MNRISAEHKCTLLALSIEKDLRNWIKSEILISHNLKSLINENILNKLKLKANAIDEDDRELINGADFGECFSILDQHKNLLTSDSKLIFNEINSILIQIKKVRDRSAHKNLLASDIDEMEDFIEKVDPYKQLFETVFSDLEKLKNNKDDKNFFLDEELESNEVIENNLPITDHQETGFIRRDKLIKKIDQTLKKNSVIVLTGDAGIGKTSIVLHKCHEIKKEIGEYDEIKWFTFKTQTFSNNEIKELNKSFKSYRHFLESFSKEKDENDQIKILLKYLTQKKCLLVLDNLETVLDQNIVKFIEASHEVDHNSKILITSREPIQSGVTIKITPFDDLSAESLFKKYSRYLDLEFLLKKNSQEIRKLVNLRENNPLGIKLSLDDVYNGTSVEKAFEPNKNFLDYSYKNLFLKLSEEAKKILEMFYYLEQEFTLTTICTYTNLEPSIVEINIADLDKKRFLVRDLKDSGTEYFSVRQIIKSFIQKNNFFKDLDSKKKIFSTHDRLKAIKSTRKINYKEIDKIRYDYSSFLKRKNSDDEAIDELLWINKNLKRRQTLMRDLTKSENDDNKDKLLNEINVKDQEIIKIFTFLKQKHPKYCEVYRVEGIFYGYLGSVQEMRNSFDTAIKLQPDYPNLWSYYIQMLRHTLLYDESIKIGLEANKIFPNFVEIEYQLLQSFYFASVYDENTHLMAIKNKESAIKFKDIDLLFAKKLAKNSLEYYRRYSEFLINSGTHEDFILAYDNIIKLAENFKEFEDLNLVDSITTATTIRKSRDELYQLKRYFSADERFEFIKGLEEVFEEKIKQHIDYAPSQARKNFVEKFKSKPFKMYEVGDTAEGILSRKLERTKFSRKIITGGFIDIIDGKFKDFDGNIKDSIYIHASQKIYPIPLGTKISFRFDTFQGSRKSVVAVDPKILNK